MIPAQLENINKLPPVVQGILSRYASKLLDALKDNITSMFVYGSAAGVNYNPGVSNVNVGVLVNRLDFDVLKQVFIIFKGSARDKMASPLLLTKDYVHNSLDVFPIEFSEIKEQHIIIYGDDFFGDLNIPQNDVRLLCEQQIKGKLLHLRQAYLNMGSNPSAVKNFMTTAFSDLIPVFRRLIGLKGQVACVHKEDMLHQLAGIFSLDATCLLAILHDKNRKLLISSGRVEAHLKDFLIQLENLSRHMDVL